MQPISCGVERNGQAAPANAADESAYRSELYIENRQQDFENEVRISIESKSEATRKHQNRVYTEGMITKGARAVKKSTRTECT